MSDTFEIIEKQEQPVLSVRRRTPAAGLTGAITQAYQEVFSYLDQLGEHPADIPFTAYYNMDMQDLDVEIGVAVRRLLPGKGAVHQSVIPAGRQASCVYKGPYSDIGAAYDALDAWINEKGLAPTGVCYEYYLNTPGQVPDSELLTKIVFLLK
jgi:effector-binding domain-containing protein